MRARMHPPALERKDAARVRRRFMRAQPDVQLAPLILRAVDPKYDYVSTVDAATGSYSLFVRVPRKDSNPPVCGVDFDADVRRYNEEHVEPDCAGALSAQMSIARIVAELEHAEEYCVFFSMVENGERLRKRIRFCWLDGRRERFLMSCVDITELVSAQLQRAEQEVISASYLDNLPVACCVLKIIFDDQDRPVDSVYVYSNREHARLNGFEHGKVVGQRQRARYLSTQDPSFELIFDTALTGDEHEFECFYETLDKHLLVRTFQPERGYCGCVISDITERHLMVADLKRQATIDALTGVLNAGAGRRAVEQRIARLDGSTTGFLIILDLDYFKRVNDVFGHHAGDRLLKLFARVLASVFRSSDTIFRLGGDEFAVYMESTHDPHALAKTVMERLYRELDAEAIEGVPMQASAGIYASSTETSFDAFYSQADDALYRSKGRGRHTWTLEVG